MRACGCAWARRARGRACAAVSARGEAPPPPPPPRGACLTPRPAPSVRQDPSSKYGDRAKDFSFYKKAAGAGHQAAQTALALNYESGLLVEQDAGKAVLCWARHA